MKLTRRTILRALAGLLALAALLGALWWGLFGLKAYAISPAELQARYHPGGGQPTLQWQDLEGHAKALRFRSFDGAEVNGRLVYPGDPAQARQAFPLLIALHAMGRSHKRWWQPDIDGRPTREQTHRITEQALAQGYAVLALDARLHGERKDPAQDLRRLIRDLHLWGAREPYERMIVDTVRDYRHALDALQALPQLDTRQVAVVGYSMGAQMALLLGGVDARVQRVAALVPPHLDEKVAAVAPRSLLPGLAGKQVWLFSASDDEYASPAQSLALFEAIPSAAKQHVRFEGGHLLPATYVELLQPWLAGASSHR